MKKNALNKSLSGNNVIFAPLKHITALCAVIIIALFIALSPLKAAATDYYVDAAGGNDSNNGLTSENAWKTLNKVSNPGFAFQPGDQILLKRGEKWYEGIWFKYSGEDGNPIIIGAYGNEADPLPLLDGTYWGSISWENVTGGIYKTSSPSWPSDPGILFYDDIPGPSITTLESATSVDDIKPGAVLVQTSGYYGNFYVTAVNPQTRKLYGITFFRDPEKYWLSETNVEVRQIDEVTGKEVTSPLTISVNGGLHVEPESLTEPGQWYWNPDDKALYLYADSLDNADNVDVGQNTWGIVANTQHDITVENLAFRGFKEVGAYFAGCIGIKVNNVSLFGIGTNGHMTGILLLDTKNSIVENSKVEYALRTGISIYDWRLEADLSSNNTISGNEIINSGSAGISLATDTVERRICIQNSLIAGNTIENSNLLSYDAAGIYMLNVGEGNRIISNIIRNGGSAQLRSAGIMVDSDVLPVVIDGNTIENNSLGGITVTGASHIITNNFLRNNGVTSWDSAQLTFFTVKSNAQGCTVEHNTLDCGADQMLFVVLNGKPTASDQPHIINNNDYISANDTPFCWINKYTCPGEDKKTFPQWKCASGTLIDSQSSFNGEQPPEEPAGCEEIIPPPHRDPATFYISSSTGDDSNDGLSESAPWETAWKLASSDFLVPGDIINFKRGDIWHERLWINSSGTENAPIVINSYGNEEEPPPLFDGTTLHNIEWDMVSGYSNIYHTSTPSWNNDPGLIIINDIAYPSIATLHFSDSTPVDNVKPGAALITRIPNYANFHVTSVDSANNTLSGTTFFRDPATYWVSGADIEVRQVNDEGLEETFHLTSATEGGLTVTPQGLTAPGHWYWDSTDGSLYLYSDTDPALLSLGVGELAEGIYMMQMNYVIFQNLDVSGFKENGLHFFFCKNITVENVHVGAIGANGHSTGILLHNTDHSIIRNCTVDNVLGNGIGLYAWSPDFELYNSNYNIIENNIIRNPGSTGISLSTEFPQQATNVSHNIIRNNTIENANSISYDAAGIYIITAGNYNLAAGNDNVIRGNTIRNCGTATLRSAGIMLDTDVSPVLVEDNIIENNAWYGIAVTGTGHRIENNVLQYNGVLPGDRGQIVFFSGKGKNATGCTVINNTVRADEDQNLFVILDGYDPVNDLPNQIDYNTYEIYPLTDIIDETYPAFCWNVGSTCGQLKNFAEWRDFYCSELKRQAPCRDASSVLFVHMPAEAKSDYDGDGDIDGLDLNALADGLNSDVTLEEFARMFGNVF